MLRFVHFLIAGFIVFIYTILSILLAIPAIILGTLARLMPVKSWRKSLMQLAFTIPVLWASVSNLFLDLRPHHHWKVEGDAELDPKKWYLLIANHQSWLDILVLQHTFNQKIPPIKFFMKKELLWSLPVLGLACWLLGYPFVHRYSRKAIRKNPKLKGKDVETTQRACQKAKEFPLSLINFAEGTRYSPEKHRLQQSPFLHLLKPKSAGIAIVTNELSDKLAGILNVTIHYSKKMSFLEYFIGGPAEITVHYELIPLAPHLIGDYYKDRQFRSYFQKWLNGLWKDKDLLLNKLNHS